MLRILLRTCAVLSVLAALLLACPGAMADTMLFTDPAAWAAASSGITPVSFGPSLQAAGLSQGYAVAPLTLGGFTFDNIQHSCPASINGHILYVYPGAAGTYPVGINGSFTLNESSCYTFGVMTMTLPAGGATAFSFHALGGNALTPLAFDVYSGNNLIYTNSLDFTSGSLFLGFTSTDPITQIVMDLAPSGYNTMTGVAGIIIPDVSTGVAGTGGGGTPTPEPGTALLLGTGLVAVCLKRSRRHA